MAELHYTPAEGDAQRHVLGDGPLVIGRGAACDIRLDGATVSRRHAQIRRDGVDYHIEDLQSLHGLWLNGERIATSKLRHGDVIGIGGVRTVFLAEAAGQADPLVTLADERRSQQVQTLSGPPAELSLSARRLQMICGLSARLTRLRDVRELLNDAMDLCFQTLGFERGAIALRSPDGRSVTWPVARHVHGSDGELAASRTILARALEHGERCIIQDGDPSFGQIESMARLGVRSAMCVPLMAGEEILGVIYGDRFTTGAVYSTEDVDLLYALAGQLSIGLVNSRLMEEHKRKLILEQQIALAREVQEFLFPADLPEGGDIQAAALNAPGQRVSGDYYDVVRLEDGRWGLLIADVSGKGVASSLLMANLQGTVRATLPRGSDAGELLTQWNRLVCANTNGCNFITCLAAILDPAGRRLQTAAAGHLPPYLVRGGGRECQSLALPVGLPLGIDPDAEYASALIELPTDPCTLFLYTDGVSEAKDAERAEFGEQRLRAALSGAASLDPEGLIGAVARAVRGFVRDAPQSDDLTMLAVQVKETSKSQNVEKSKQGTIGASSASEGGTSKALDV